MSAELRRILCKKNLQGRHQRNCADQECPEPPDESRGGKGKPGKDRSSEYSDCNSYSDSASTCWTSHLTAGRGKALRIHCSSGSGSSGSNGSNSNVRSGRRNSRCKNTRALQTQVQETEVVPSLPTGNCRHHNPDLRKQEEVGPAADPFGVSAMQGNKQVIKDYVSRMANSTCGNVGRAPPN